MKSFTVALIALFMLSCASYAQELPGTYGFGMLVAKESTPVPAFFTSFNQNIHKIVGESGTTKMQFSIDATTMYLDDYYSDRVDANVLGIEAIPTIKLFAGKTTLAVGFGGRWEVASGDDGFKFPVTGELGWIFAPGYASFNVGFAYIPMNQHRPDYWFPTVSVGLDGPKVLTAFTGWLTR